jgi:hypothetical protein
VFALATADLGADGPSRMGVLTAVPSIPGALTRRRRIFPWLQHRFARLTAAQAPLTSESERVARVAP